ncbi:MAG: thiamine pyrophosphate-dependent enzyme [Alphaproteobacteria bacterium]|nr:thiamine pyrophosphate-dependent enzyme [Alphaproteobacteria bacterium]
MVDVSLDRRELLPKILPSYSEYLIVSGLAGASRDAAALTSEGDNLFTMGGAMGAAVSIGLGMALCAPDKKIAVITGDGELMMNIGSLATVASAAPQNLSIICIDNGQHGETGGQKGHTAERTDLELMAQGAGIPATLTISRPDELEAAARFLTESPAPRFLWARVLPGPPSDWKRNWNLADCRTRFRDAVLRGSGG